VNCEGKLLDRLPARSASIGVLRHAVTEFAAGCGASEVQLEDIALAVSEALSNVVLHAYAGCDPPGDITVEAWMSEQGFVVVVGDEGSGIVPRADSPGLGLGLPLIAKLADQLDLAYAGARDGASVRMSFSIGP
jgi:serine/threonine-protein kinase RsbW